MVTEQTTGHYWTNGHCHALPHVPEVLSAVLSFGLWPKLFGSNFDRAQCGSLDQTIAGHNTFVAS